MYESLKLIHMWSAALSISGFVLRSYWMMSRPQRLQRRWVKILPHVIDSIFLLSGVALFYLLNLLLMQNAWLQIKLVALVGYVVLGTLALKRGRTMRVRITASVLAVLTFGYIVGIALAKSGRSWLAVANI